MTPHFTEHASMEKTTRQSTALLAVEANADNIAVFFGPAFEFACLTLSCLAAGSLSRINLREIGKHFIMLDVSKLFHPY